MATFPQSYIRPHETLCGCYIFVKRFRKYLPQVSVNAHTTILADTSRTTLTQNFVNPNEDSALDEIRYVFPLYDGVSVVAFTCTVGDRVIKGVVKEREKAKKDYNAAKAKGETAGLLEQSLEAADVFTTSIGNVPAGEKIKVEITFLGELKHDAEVDGVRFTIPTSIVPRYGEAQSLSPSNTLQKGGFTVTVDAEMPSGSLIKSVQSPSHPISVSIGTISTAADAEPSLQRAHATLSLGSAELEKEFVIQVVATNLGNPTAILETHPTIPNQRALMTTLVPKFSLPADKPEIVFICDRSGSMSGKIPDLVAALQIFLKSLPVGVKFNICSFGSKYDFLWSKSKAYSQDTLDKAVKHVKTFSANYGGTEMYKPVQETFKRRYSDLNLEVFLLTDGEIWDQEKLFELINEQVAKSKGAIRLFSLGVGSGASTSLIEGVARAGNGFSQSVADNEKMDKKVIRMLKGALFPHISDYSLEIKYAKDESDDDDFEVIEKVMDSLSIDTEKPSSPQADAPKAKISLFNPGLKEDDTKEAAPSVENKYDNLPPVSVPKYLQTPFKIPPLFPFNRTTVYVMLSEATPAKQPKSVLLKATSNHGPLELEIPITVLAGKGETIHQLAAKREIKDLEEGRGWLTHAKDARGKLLKDKFPSQFSEMVEREAVRLGVGYQVGGKWCSFVAVQENGDKVEKVEKKAEVVGEFEVLHADYIPGGVTRGGGYGFAGGNVMHGTLGGGGIHQYRSSSARYMMPVARAAPAPAPAFAPTGGLYGGPGGAVSFSAAAPPPPPMMQSGPPVPVMNRSATRKVKLCQGAAPESVERSRKESSEEDDDDEDMGFGLALDEGGAQSSSPAPQTDTLAESAKGFKKGAGVKKGGGGLRGMFGSFGSAKLARRSSPPPASAFFAAESTALPSAVDTSNPLQALIELQTFSGAWAWSSDLEKVLGVTSQKAADLKLGDKVKGDVLATLCAVVYFKKRLAADKEAWEMLVDKAEGWLQSEVGATEELEKKVATLF